MFSHRLARRVTLGETQRERWDALCVQNLCVQNLRGQDPRVQNPRGLGASGDGPRGHDPGDGGRPGDRERRRFALSRGLVQSAVAEFLGESGPDLVLDARCPSCGGPHGPLVLGLSPSASSASSAPTVPSLSLSTSEDVIVVAVSDDARLGVDVEVLFSARRGVASGDVARRVRDVAAVLDMDAGNERDVLQRWVRVEAVLKADGRGLRVDPCDVSVIEEDADDQDHDNHHDQDDDGGAGPATGSRRWRATVRDDADVVYRGSDLALAPGIVGAVAWHAELR